MPTVMQYVLPLFSIFALYAIFYFSASNRLLQLAVDAVESKTLPGTTYSLRTEYTGIEPIDQLLTTLTVFFWPVLDASNANSVLHSVYFAGAFGSAWVLVTLEAWRAGNAWKVVSFPMVFGLAAQVLTFAFATPLYCALQLAQSVTARKPNASNIGISRSVLRVVPPIFLLGYLMPSVLMVLPAPELVSVDLKQIFIAIWQPWPGYVSVLVTVIGLLFSGSKKKSSNINTSVAENRATRSCLRWVYAFAFANAALSHILSWTVSLATVIVPTLLTEKFAGVLHPSSVFKVTFPWTSPAFVVDSVSHGVHVFLQWDFIIGTSAVLVWALTLYAIAHRQILGRVGYLGLGVKTGFLVILTGPVAAAVELIWERDELVLQETGDFSLRKVAGGKKGQ